MPALVAGGWNFKTATPENLELIAAIARVGSVSAMRDLLARGAPVGQTQALQTAAERGEDAIVDLLLAAHIPWDKSQLNAALVKIAAFGKLPTMRRLLAAGANAKVELPYTRETGLMMAAGSGSPETVAFMLRSSPDVNKKDATGQTALHHAVIGAALSYPVISGADAIRVVELLLAAGASANRVDRMANTPLLYVGSRADIANLLIARGANVNHINRSGDTALLKAFDFPSTAKALLDHGANPNSDPRSKKTPLFLAAQRPQLVSLLITAGADVNARDPEGNTLLMYCPHRAVVDELMRAHANLTIRNNKGASTLDVLNAKTKDNKCPPDITLAVGRAIEAAKSRK